jgi:hypothetical protein
VARDARLSTHAKITTLGVGPIKIGVSVRTAEQQSRSDIDARKVSSDCSQGPVHPLKLGVSVLATRGRIQVIYVKSRGIATRSGVRVKDTVAHLKRVYGARLVKVPPPYNPTWSNYELRDRNRKILFSTDNRKIFEIATGREPEVDYMEGCY